MVAVVVEQGSEVQKLIHETRNSLVIPRVFASAGCPGRRAARFTPHVLPRVASSSVKLMVGSVEADRAKCRQENSQEGVGRPRPAPYQGERAPTPMESRAPELERAARRGKAGMAGGSRGPPEQGWLPVIYGVDPPDGASCAP